MRIETDSQHYTDIAEAIRDMNGTENTYYPEEMASAILAIPQETYDVFAPIIYSLEEREVGVWTDGKPLYQRVFEFTNALTIPSSSWTLTNIDSTNIEKIVYCTGIHSDGTCYAFIGADPTQSTHSKVGVWSTRNSNITLKGLILQYTKISDVAGSGSWGTDSVPMVHYDGTERIIGTYFGDTLYQKSYIFNNYALVAGQNLIDLPILRDIDIIVNSVIVMSNSAHTNFRTLNGYDLASGHSNSAYYVLHKQVAESSLQYKLELLTSSSWATPNIYITLQYTKPSS